MLAAPMLAMPSAVAAVSVRSLTAPNDRQNLENAELFCLLSAKAARTDHKFFVR